MRILAIRGRNLASLSGDFSVDFEAEPLASAGIFAITGPTGAGKSTLLDAVCLALFAEIPRLRAAPASGAVGHEEGAISARDARSILSHGAGDGFAEVDFAIPAGGRYRARWDVRRARGRAEGNLQNYSHAFERLDTGERMGGTRTETRTAIAGVIGLSAEQFTRAVLLAQGDFEAFIRADANDRAALLERLTGSQIYTRIGQRAYAKASDLRAGLETLRQQITAQEGLDDAARALAEEALRQAEADHAAARARLGALEAEERWQARHAQLGADLDSARQGHDAALAEQAAAQPRREALTQDRAAFALTPQLAARDAARGALIRAETALAQARSAATAAMATAETRKQEAGQAAEALAHAEQQARDLAPAIDAARTLDRQITETEQALATLAKDEHAAEQAARAAQEQATTARADHAAAEARQQAAQAWLDTHAALRMLAEREDEIAGLLATREQTQTRRHQHERQARALEADEHAAMARHGTARDALEHAEQAADAAQTRRAAAEASLPGDDAFDRLTHQIDRIAQTDVLAIEAEQALRESTQAQAALAETQARRATLARRLGDIAAALAGHDLALPALDAQLVAARRVLAQSLAASDKAAEALRAGLIAGEPCPVCGATQHGLSALDSLLGEHLEANRAQTQHLEDALARLRGDQQALRRECGMLGEQDLALQREEGGQAERIAPLQVRAEQTGLALREALAALGLTHDAPARAALQTLRDATAQERDGLLALRAAADLARRAQEDARAALDTARQAESQALDTLRLRSQALNDCRQTLEQLGQSEQACTATLDMALAGVADWRHTPDPQGWLRKQAQAWRDHQANLADAQQTMPSLIAAMHHAISLCDQALARHQAAAAQRAERADALALRRAERAPLLQGQSVAEAEQALALATQTARMASEDARIAREQAAQAHAGARAAEQAANEQQARAALDLDHAAAELATRLAAGPMAEADVARVAAAGLASLEREGTALAKLDSAVGEAEAVLAQCRNQLDRHQAEPHDKTLTPADLAEAKTGAASADRETALTLEEARLRIRQDDRVRAQTAALRARLESATAQADVWLRLSELIGDREGKTLRRFAQGLTLDRLLDHANARLADLKPRFALERGMGGDMLIQVIDNDMGGQVRGLHNLSGGERFLVSLALALGLAEMSTARGVRIESLFIDEGFGALDPASLGQALGLLEHLHATGRRVGVISHVEELKERVPVKIEVAPTGRGTSRITVVEG